MPSRRIRIIRAARIVNLIRAAVDILDTSDLLAIEATLDFPVAVREDTAVGELVEALAVREKGLGVGLEPCAGGEDDFVQDLAVVIEGPELLLAGRLPNILVGLD